MLTLSAGLTHQLSRNFFINYGLGYSERDYYIGLKKYQYNPDSNYTPDLFNFESAYGLVIDESYKGMNGQLGFIIRFKEKLILSLNWTANLGDNVIVNDDFKYRNSDLLLSVGYNF
jgi:hypothetical protein